MGPERARRRLRVNDLRLEEIPFEFNGKTYQLRCNMNVLADVQDVYGGAIGKALAGDKPTRSVLEFLAAMLNDYAEEQGWPERYTSRDVGRKFAPGSLPVIEIMGLVTRAITPPKQVSAADTENPAPETGDEDPGNSGN